MDKVKIKKDGKKSDRPASSIDVKVESRENSENGSSTLPVPVNVKKDGLTSKNKALTISADELNRQEDKVDGNCYAYRLAQLDTGNFLALRTNTIFSLVLRTYVRNVSAKIVFKRRKENLLQS